MKGAALCCWAPLLLLTLQGPASGHPGPGKHPSQELQDLLDLLKEEPQGEPLEMLDYGAGEEEPGWDLAVPESGSPPPQLPPRDPLESQWRDLLASPRRMRHFSGCFGIRIERIGSQTGLGCNSHKARRFLEEEIQKLNPERPASLPRIF